ncbi:MAG: anthranilate 1,2-dioxygenase [Rhizobacter sp.]|nr:anthranilate 1,2-dioxygenase [Rhizobacter sp.]
MTAPIDAMLLWFELYSLQERYVAALDGDRLEDWAAMFTEDCLYEIVPKENEDMGLPMGLIRCDNQRMLRDRVLSLRHASIFDAHTYRHMTSGLTITSADADSAAMSASYVVVQTRSNGESQIFQAGRYDDRVVRVNGQWLYASKRCIYDTSRVQTLLATPI